MRTSLLVLALSFTSAMTACSTMTTSHEETAALQRSTPGSWTLESSDRLTEVPANILVTLRPDGSNTLGVSGFSGVNHFIGNATVDWPQKKLVFGTMASTRMMGPEPRMQFEKTFLKQLESVVKFKLGENGKLIFLTKSNEKIIFKHGPQ